MTKEQFVTHLVQKLSDTFPPEEFNLHTKVVTKNNSTKHHGIIIQNRRQELAPTLYVDEFYEDYLEKKITLSEIIVRIEDTVHEFSVRRKDFHAPSMEWDECRDRLVYRLVSRSRNEEILRESPYIPFLDLAIVFYAVTHISEHNLESVRITNKLKENWGVSVKELYQTAEKNTPILFEPKIQSLHHALCDYFEEELLPTQDDLAPMLIATNQMGINGASVLLYKNLVENLAGEYQTGLYILPSSIHEILIMPAEEHHSLTELNNLVCSVNQKYVNEEEILSDCAYYYDWEQKKFIF